MPNTPPPVPPLLADSHDPASATPRNEYTVDELARVTDTTVRNVRAYQDRGLLAPPEKRGRVAVYELLEIDRVQADAIRRQDLTEFAQLAYARPDYQPLTKSAIDLAARGLTTIAEVISSVSGIVDEPQPVIAASPDESEMGPAQVLSLLT